VKTPYGEIGPEVLASLSDSERAWLEFIAARMEEGKRAA